MRFTGRSWKEIIERMASRGWRINRDRRKSRPPYIQFYHPSIYNLHFMRATCTIYRDGSYKLKTYETERGALREWFDLLPLQRKRMLWKTYRQEAAEPWWAREVDDENGSES